MGKMDIHMNGRADVKIVKIMEWTALKGGATCMEHHRKKEKGNKQECQTTQGL